MAVAPVWTLNTQRVKTVKQPADALAYEIRMAYGQWQTDLQFIARSSLHFNQLADFERVCARPTGLSDYTDLVLWLCRSRAASLVHHTDDIPRCFAALLHASPEVANGARARALRHWEILLDTETLQRHGHLHVH